MGQYRHSPAVVGKLLDLAAQGKTGVDAAAVLGLAPKTATTYIKKAKEMGRDAFMKEVTVNYCGFSEEAPVARSEQSYEAYNEKNIAPDPDMFGRLILKECPDSVLIIPDLQFPFAHKDCLNFLAMVAQRYKPDMVIGIGDEVDNNFLSAYEKDPDLMGASQEYIMAQEQMSQLFKLFPRAYGLHSNHGKKRISGAWKRAGIPSCLAPKYADFLAAPRGWAWYEEVRLDNILFHHGDGEKAINSSYLLKHIPAEYGRHFNVVHGHRHEQCGRKANETVGDVDYWGAYTGCLIDPYSKAFGYTKGRKAKLGCGVIVHGEYKQIRMVLDNDGRWIGTI